MFEKLRALFEQLPALLQQVALSMQNLGTGAYLIVSLVVLGETIVGLGILLPGTLFLVFVGFLCYLQIYDLGGMFVSVVIAHYLGEAANYMLGRTKGRALFRPESKVFRPALLESAERRLRDHGTKMIIVTQFLGMLRPFMGVVAGATHYSPWRFAGAMAVGGFLWSAAPLVLGYLGGASWRQAVKYLENFSTILLVAIPVLLLSGWVIRTMGEFLALAPRGLELLARRIKTGRHYTALASRNPRLFGYLERRLSLSQPWGLAATFGFLLTALLLLAFLWVLRGIVIGNRWRDLDLSIVNLLAQIRHPLADRVFLFFATIGNGIIALLVAILAAAICLKARQMKSMVVILGSTILAMAIAELMHLGYSRPHLDVAAPLLSYQGYSFPSSHAAVVVALFSALSYWVWNHPARPALRTSVAFLCLTLILLVGFSRMYLGLHFPSDVTAGICLGTAVVVLLITIAGNAQRLIDLPRRADYAVLSVMLIHLAAAAGYSWSFAPKPPPPRAITTAHRVAAEGPLDAASLVPMYATNLLGTPSYPTNILIVAPKSDGAPASSDATTSVPVTLQRALLKLGWRAVPPDAFFTREVAAPVFPAFLQGVPAAATYRHRIVDDSANPAEAGDLQNDENSTSSIDAQTSGALLARAQEAGETTAAASLITSRQVLRLWRANITVEGRTLWVGAIIEEKRRRRAFGLSTSTMDPDIDLAAQNLAAQLAPLLPSSVIPHFRPRGLYQDNPKRPFFTHGDALLLDLSSPAPSQ